MTEIDKAIGIDLLQQFLMGQYQQPDMMGLLQQTNQNKDQNMRRMLDSFGTQGKPMRHTGINGGRVDPMTGMSTSGLDQFYAQNPQLRRGESNANAKQRLETSRNQEQQLGDTQFQNRLDEEKMRNQVLQMFMEQPAPSSQAPRPPVTDMQSRFANQPSLTEQIYQRGTQSQNQPQIQPIGPQPSLVEMFMTAMGGQQQAPARFGSGAGRSNF